jgi:hypothetical protein
VGTHKDEAFRQAVSDSSLQDPMPTLENLARSVGLHVDEVVLHALVRWVAAGSEALMTLDSLVLEDLIAARRRDDWRAVAGIIDWLEVGRSPPKERSK